MPYSLASDVRKQTPFKDTTLINDAYITQKIAEADDLINSVIGGVYKLPLSTVPNIIVDLSKEIAGLIIFREQDVNIEVQPGIKVEDQWKIQMEILSAIGTRKIKLFGDGGTELQINSSGTISGYPTTSSSSPDADNSTQPKFTMNMKF